MGEATLVETHIECGEQLIEELHRGGFDVTAAAWVKTSDDGQWFLYIASSEVDRVGITDAYKDVYLTTKRLENPWLDPFDVKLIRPSDPITDDILEKRRRIPRRYRGNRLGKLSIDDAFIYPPVTPLPP